MKYERVKYTKQFDFQIGEKEWIGVEALIEPGDSEDEVFRAVKAKVHQLAGQSSMISIPLGGPNPATGIVPEIRIERPHTDEEQIRQNREAILSCTELKVLESYKIIAKSNPQLTEAYDTMYKKLSK